MKKTFVLTEFAGSAGNAHPQTALSDIAELHFLMPMPRDPHLRTVGMVQNIWKCIGQTTDLFHPVAINDQLHLITPSGVILIVSDHIYIFYFSILRYTYITNKNTSKVSKEDNMMLYAGLALMVALIVALGFVEAQLTKH